MSTEAAVPVTGEHTTQSPLGRVILVSAVILTVLIVICYDVDNMPLFYLNWTLSSIFLGLFFFTLGLFIFLDYFLDKSVRPWMSDSNSKHRARRTLHIPFHIYEFLQYFAILTAFGYAVNAVTWTIWYYRQETYNNYFNNTMVSARVAECGPLYAWQKTQMCSGIEASYTWFYYKQWPLYLHAIPGGIVLATGAHQIWWKRGTRIHKWTGYIYFTCQLVAAAGAISLSLISSSVVVMGGFLLLAAYWILTLGFGMYYITLSKRSDRIQRHRECMLLNYGATWSAVSLRFGSVFGSGIWFQGIPWSLIFPVLSVIAAGIYVRVTREKQIKVGDGNT